MDVSHATMVSSILRDLSSVLCSIWKGHKSPWIGAEPSTAVTIYDQLPVAKDIVLHRPGGMTDWTIFLGLSGVGVRVLRASSPLVAHFLRCSVVPKLRPSRLLHALDGDPSVGVL